MGGLNYNPLVTYFTLLSFGLKKNVAIDSSSDYFVHRSNENGGLG